MRITLTSVLELHFVCVQCQKELNIKGPSQNNPSPLLECPECGFKVQVIQPVPGIPVPGSSKRFPPLRPKKV